MPKVEVNEKLLFEVLKRKIDYKELDALLPRAKAELDDLPKAEEKEEERVIKIELNDTNRPDLWSTTGLGRALRLILGERQSDYTSFLSDKNRMKDYKGREVTVDERLKEVRPYMVAFAITGKAITDSMLKDIIQTQEKLAFNFGQKRRSISMGIYRLDNITFPVHYKAVDPDATSFIPLQSSKKMTCREILKEHPKGHEYGWILQDKALFPLLVDDKGEVLSMAPIINSATLGAVEVGDRSLMVELTGDNIENLVLSANIVACDFFDCGYKIEPILVKHPYDTGLGFNINAPLYFQEPTTAFLSHINKTLGSTLTKEEVLAALYKMGGTVSVKEEENGDALFTLYPPPYRNDFLHEVDIIEDVLIGCGLEAFTPLPPSDFTIGSLLPLTKLSRKIKTQMIGLGFQEMIYNYVGSKKEYIDNMNVRGEEVIEIENPMSENYQFIRSSILPSLLNSESLSATSIYPHKIFEIGKVSFIDNEAKEGTTTRQKLGFLYTDKGVTFNEVNSIISSLLYYFAPNYKIKEAKDPRFIAGRQAEIYINKKEGSGGGEVKIGVFGEVSPIVLTNWQIFLPAVMGELDIEALLKEGN